MAAAAVFTVGAVVSLSASWLLVSRLERIGERLGLSEALLGIVAALAADAPEITAAISALSSHQQRIGAGVVLGSNVFNLAALLGLGALVAGWIGLHRKVVALSGISALWVALVSVMVVSGAVPPLAGLALAGVVFALYLVVLGTAGQGMPIPAVWRAWLRSAVSEEELELKDAIRPGRGRWTDAVTAAAALGVVIAASVAMERAAVSIGSSRGVPGIITGGLVLAAVTSLPNAVAAVYLANRGRGAAALSTALSSNTLNVLCGLLLPGVVLGLGRPSGQAELVTAWYAALTLAVLVLAWRHQGLSRISGAAIISAYAAFTVCVVATGYATPGSTALVVGLSVVSCLTLAVAAMRRSRTAASSRVSVRLADWPSGHRPPAAPVADGGASLLPGWHARRLWAASMLAASLVAVLDAATGHRVILIGLLIVGPCIALLTGSWLRTAATGVWACGLSVLLGVPDGIWGNATHLTFICTTTVVAATAAAAAAVIGRTQDRRTR